MKKLFLLTGAVLISTSLFAQMQLDNKIQLTGSGGNAKIEGIDEIINNSDAANKIYVDTAIANRAGGSGLTPKRAFVSSVEYYGNLGNHSGANTKCDNLAAAAGIGGSWLAWISTGGLNAKDKSSYTNPIVDMKGGTVSSAGWPGLLGPVNGAIKFDEYGNFVDGGRVMTGTQSNGTARPSYHCNDFTSSSFGNEVQVGYSTISTAGWTAQDTWRCWELNRIYCIEQ